MPLTRIASVEDSVSSDRELLLTPILDRDVDDSDASSLHAVGQLPTAAGLLSSDEDNERGLGRHLGLYSTTLLM